MQHTKLVWVSPGWLPLQLQISAQGYSGFLLDAGKVVFDEGEEVMDIWTDYTLGGLSCKGVSLSRVIDTNGLAVCPLRSNAESVIGIIQKLLLPMDWMLCLRGWTRAYAALGGKYWCGIKLVVTLAIFPARCWCKEWSGWEPFSASDLHDAITYFRGHQPDIQLLGFLWDGDASRRVAWRRMGPSDSDAVKCCLGPRGVVYQGIC